MDIKLDNSKATIHIMVNVHGLTWHPVKGSHFFFLAGKRETLNIVL